MPKDLKKFHEILEKNPTVENFMQGDLGKGELY